MEIEILIQIFLIFSENMIMFRKCKSKKLQSYLKNSVRKIKCFRNKYVS